MNTVSFDPSALAMPQLHGYLLGAVAPRPIAFASTISANGEVNLAPFSFFNCFSAAPPILIFSPARSGRDNTTKHTHDNVKEVKEVVINVVDYSMVQQMSLASTAYDKGVNEFEKAGLTPIPSEKVAPPRVAESPVQFECKVNEVIELGQTGGAGNLVICEVVKIHIKAEVLDENQKIDPIKIDLVGRHAGNYYVHAQGDALFEIPKPIASIGMGIDMLPESIRNSKLLSGNDLGKLGTLDSLPDTSVSDKVKTSMAFKSITQGYDGEEKDEAIALQAKRLLEDNEIEEAMAWLMTTI